MRLQYMAAVALLAACHKGGTAMAEGLPFTVTPVGSFASPWAMAFLPDGSALVTEKKGTIEHWTGPGRPLAKVAGVPKVAVVGQGGLLDIRLAPDFATSRAVYFTYSEPSANGGSGLALARGTLNAAVRSLDNVRVIWRDPQGGEGGQFGAKIAFAPDGKSLFLSSGERQRFTPAQDANQPVGKILQLTLDGQPAPGNPFAGKAGAPVTMLTDPPDNTEVARKAATRAFRWPGPNPTPAETWSLGHRNPYGLAFDSAGRLWETEMGPKGGDELNLIEPGKNYGWPLVSEGQNYDGVPIPKPSTRPDLAPAKLFWVPSVSPTTLMFYDGKLFPQWKGNGFIGTLSGQALIRVTFDGISAAKADQWDMGNRIRFVTEGPDGAIYLLEDGDGGRLLKLTPAARQVEVGGARRS
ncbi:PQQ-dependent sugar dehydrogenase [Sphingomonas sp. ASV193]|uniref:PQQ-dependent sugar dehydrogenase n=1 Tax=Sphingomonas sp. ASV193 TaxID=3144405 RepID=UPI0032E8AF48